VEGTFPGTVNNLHCYQSRRIGTLDTLYSSEEGPFIENHQYRSRDCKTDLKIYLKEEAIIVKYGKN